MSGDTARYAGMNVKMSITRIISIITAFCCITLSASAGESVGGYAGAFLQMASGARPAAMGGAYLGISDDGAAPLYNPGGLALLKHPIISTSYRLLQFDRTLGYFSALFPVQGEATLGISWLYAGSGTVAERDGDGALTGEDFSFNQHQFSLTFSKRFEKYLSVGTNISFLLARFPEVEANSVGFDFGGMLYVDQLINRNKRDRMPIQDVRVGLTIKNLSKRYSWNSEKYARVRTTSGLGVQQEDVFPIEVGLGVSGRLMQRTLVLALDLLKNNKQKIVFRSGGEYYITPRFALRAGYGRSHLAAGVGFVFSLGKKALAIDYAFSAERAYEGSEHIFSFDFLL